MKLTTNPSLFRPVAPYGAPCPAICAPCKLSGTITRSIYCFFDGPVSEEDADDMGVAATEVAADFPDHMVDEHCIRADYPTPIKPTDKARHMVFLRKEK